MTRSRVGHALATFGDVLNHLQSTGKGESGILMRVHPAGLLKVWVFGDFQFPDSVRMNLGFNVLKLHSYRGAR
ncbi:hypothetical protein UW163_22060 (plasmid) [Ralstonia solanacearum]|nr:hypothetical protein UW163_22060 [Ralstonia solanacearum]EUJ12988.1 hypothetical protein RSP673_18120 [Ralstonia solanacearum P673]